MPVSSETKLRLAPRAKMNGRKPIAIHLRVVSRLTLLYGPSPCSQRRGVPVARQIRPAVRLWREREEQGVGRDEEGEEKGAEGHDAPLADAELLGCRSEQRLGASVGGRAEDVGRLRQTIERVDELSEHDDEKAEADGDDRRLSVSPVGRVPVAPVVRDVRDAVGWKRGHAHPRGMQLDRVREPREPHLDWHRASKCRTHTPGLKIEVREEQETQKPRARQTCGI